MTEKSQTEIVSRLKTEMQSHVDLTNLSDCQLQVFITDALEKEVDHAKAKLPGADKELLTLNFKEKK